MPSNVLLSRQHSVFKNSEKLAAACVLLIGCTGVGMEVLKNLLLAGVGNFKILDNTKFCDTDFTSMCVPLSNNFKGSRAEFCKSAFARFGRSCKIEVVTTVEEALKDITMVVNCTNDIISEYCVLSDMCRENSIAVISVGVYGAFGFMFSDFGKTYTYFLDDGSGVYDQSFPILSINHKDGIATVTLAHNVLSDGMKVKFFRKSPSETTLHEDLPFDSVEVTRVDGCANSFTFNSSLVSKEYVGNASLRIEREQASLSFESMKEKLVSYQCHPRYPSHANSLLALKAINDFVLQSNVKVPQNMEDVRKVVTHAKAISVDIDEKQIEFIKQVCISMHGNLAPMNAIFGGLVGQETMKYITRMYTPLKTHLFDQFFFLNFLDIIPSEFPKINKRTNSRYAGQIQLFGEQFQKELLASNTLVAGAGAVGCEVLKNLACMGVGNIAIIDFDRIAESNLHRQLLFTNTDTGKSKATVAMKRIRELNPMINCDAFVGKAELSNPDFEAFWNSKVSNLNCIISAVDTVEGRTYLSNKAIGHEIPMLEGGTRGVSSSSLSIICNTTMDYSDQFIEQSEQPLAFKQGCIPTFLVYKPSHLVRLSQEKFSALFEDLHLAQQLWDCERSIDSIVMELLDRIFNSDVEILQQKYIKELQESKDTLNEIAKKFLNTSLVRQEIRLEKDSTMNKLFTVTKTLVEQLKASKKLIYFEKDEELHLDFVYYCSQIFSSVFDISMIEDREDVRQIAGSIIPAIITTTAITAGFICMNYYRIIRKTKITEMHCNTATWRASFHNPPCNSTTKGELKDFLMKYINHQTKVEHEFCELRQVFELDSEPTILSEMHPRSKANEKVLDHMLCLKRYLQTPPPFAIYKLSVQDTETRFKIFVSVEAQIKDLKLKNYYGDCYLNSALQLLNIAKEWKHSLLKLKDDSTTLKAMKSIFSCNPNPTAKKYLVDLTKDEHAKFVRGEPSRAIQLIHQKLQEELKEKYEEFENLIALRNQVTTLNCKNSCKNEDIIRPVSLSVFNLIVDTSENAPVTTLQESLDKRNISKKTCSSCGLERAPTICYLNTPKYLIIALSSLAFASPSFRHITNRNIIKFQTSNYSLVGGCLYSGNGETGHWTSFVKHYKSWFIYNDSVKTQIKDDLELTNIAQDAVVLMYEKE